jgi:hypothetical protein
MSRIAITLLLALGACAAQVNGGDSGGVVEFYTTSGDAMTAATAHCRKYGKSAQPTQYDRFGYLTFSCVRS